MSGPSLFLEAADEEDVWALLAIERQCFSHPWTAGNFRDGIAERGRSWILVLRTPVEPSEPGGGIVAYCAFRVVVDELHVHNLAVHPGHRGRGLGRRLLVLAMDFAARRGARAALLEVRQSNWPALQLYRSLGFQVSSIRRNYYERPREDALLLRKPDLGPASLSGAP